MNTHTTKWAGLVFATLMLAALTGCPPTPPISPTERTPAYERAVTFLQVQAQDKDPTVRANSIEALQLAPDRRALAVLEQGLHDQAWVVRFASAMAAGRRQAMELKPALQQMFPKEDNGSVRVAMIYALKQMGDTSNMSLLAGTFKSPDASTRANTALVLGIMADKSAIGLLKSHAADPDNRVKAEITAALARLGDRDAEDAILGMSISKFAEDYYTAIATCPDINRPEVGNILANYIKLKDAYPEHPWKTAEEKLIVERAALIAARALGRIGKLKVGDLNVGDMALGYLRNPDPELRALAALALGEILTRAGEPRLEPLLQDPDPRVQLAAAAAIVNITVRATKEAAPKP